MQPCMPCARLDGEGSAIAPHAALSLQASRPVQADDLEAGTVEVYACNRCQIRLQRFCRACSLDGWLLLRPRAAAHQARATG